MSRPEIIHVGNAPCSWGVLEFDLQGQAAGPQQVLAEMRAAGYEGTELGDWGFLPTEPEALCRTLTHHALELLGAFVPVALSRPEAHAEGVQRAVRTAELLAAVAARPLVVLADDNGAVPERVANAGRIQPCHGLSDEGWRHAAAGATRVAEAVRRATGLRTVLHHHCAGYLETPAEVDRLLAATDPELLGLCLDTGHFTLGGGDPVEALERHGPRVWHVHFKDCHGALAGRLRAEGWDYFRAVREGVFCELGRGGVDFAAVLERLLSLDYQGWVVVEQDVLPGMGTPLQSAARNREFLRGLGL